MDDEIQSLNREREKAGYGRIDLHVHTTASDGSLEPGELVDHAREIGLVAVAITDHDTVGGVGEALEAGKRLGVEVIPGVEISALSGRFTPHLLGYFIDITSRRLRQALEWMLAARMERNPRIVHLLNEMNIPVSMERVVEIAGKGVVGRPHIARAIVETGAVDSVEEAFDCYLGQGKPAYLPKARLPIDKAIGTVREAGGIPVLAHPMTLTRNGADLEELVREFAGDGLEGIEVWYSEHTETETVAYAECAEKFNLVKTGGSDFHGHAKPEIELGSGTGDLALDTEILAALKQRWKQVAI